MAKPTQPLRRRFSLPVLMLFPLMLSIGGVPRPVDAAAEGFQRWFHCGMRYWTPCHRTARVPRLLAAEPHATEARRPAESELSPAELSMWGTPVVGPSGAVSYQLPPQPLLDLFRQPSDETARAYLQMWKDKAGRREAAFAALRRMAAELGFERDPHTLDDPTSSVAPALELSSPEATSLSASGSFPLSLGEATPLVRRAHTPVSPTSVGTVPSARLAKNTPAAVSTASLPVLQSATATQEMQGQQMRIFYFFSPRCPYCAQQTPLLNSFAQGRRDVVGIAMDTEREELRAHVQQMRITFPVMLDQSESRRFGVTAYPTLVVLDAEGKATRLQGLLTREELERALGGGA